MARRISAADGLAWGGAALVLAGRVLLAGGSGEVMRPTIFIAGWVTAACGDLCWVAYGLRFNPTGRPMWALVFLDVTLLVADVIGAVRQ